MGRGVADRGARVAGRSDGAGPAAGGPGDAWTRSWSGSGAIKERRLALNDGRPTIAMETFIRLMVLKQRYRTSSSKTTAKGGGGHPRSYSARQPIAQVAISANGSLEWPTWVRYVAMGALAV